MLVSPFLNDNRRVTHC